MRSTEVAQEHVAEFLAIRVAFRNVLLHHIEPFGSLRVEHLNELLVALGKPPDGDPHKERGKSGGCN